MRSLYLILLFVLFIQNSSAQEITYLDKDLGISQQKHKFVDSIFIGNIKCRFTNSLNSSDKLKLNQALVFLDSVIRTEKFRSYVMSYRFKNRVRKKTKDINGKLIPNSIINRKKKMTKKDIFNLVTTGDDRLGHPKDSILDIYLEHKEIEPNGATKNGMITLRTGRLREDEVRQLAGTILHEYGHTLGFVHFSNKRWVRSLVLSKNDVAYGFGKIVYRFK